MKVIQLALSFCIFTMLSGCYTVLKQSGAYYSEFSDKSTEQEPEPDDSLSVQDQPIPEDDEPVIVNNYLASPIYYDPWYRDPWFYRGYYPGWSVSVGYYGASWYYDPYWDPGYYYNGWCHYPVTVDPPPSQVVYNTQRAYGARQYTFANSNSSTPALRTDLSSGKRVYTAQSKQVSKTDKARMRRNYRKAYGIDGKSATSETSRRTQSTGENRESRPREIRSESSGRSQTESRSSRGESRSSGRSGERRGGEKRQYKK